MYQSQNMMVGQKEQYAVYQNLKPMLGSQGQVYFGKNLQSQQEVAIKLCVLDDNEKHFLTLYTEKKQQKTPQNLVNIFEFYQQGQNNQYIIIMERANCGDLLSFLKNTDYLKKVPNTKQTRIQFLKDIANGVKELHEMGIIHRDIKPENILVFSSSSNQFTCKICDFGLAKKADNTKTQQIGTPYYMAPEILLLDESYTNSVDIWALGCLFYEILSEKTLFNGKTIYELMNSITSSSNQVIEQRINEGLKDCGIQNMIELISKMVKRESEDRINIKEVMTYIYQIKGIQVVKIQDKPINQGNQEQLNGPTIISQSRIKIRSKQQSDQQQSNTENHDNCQQVEQQQILKKQFDQIQVENQIESCQNPNNQQPDQYIALGELQQINNLPIQACLDDEIDQKISDKIDCVDSQKQQEYECQQQQNNSPNYGNQNLCCDDQSNKSVPYNYQKDCENNDCQVDKIDNLHYYTNGQKSDPLNLIKENLNKAFIQKIFNNQHEPRLNIYLGKLQEKGQNWQNLSEVQIKEGIKPFILEDISQKLKNFTYAQ